MDYDLIRKKVADMEGKVCTKCKEFKEYRYFSKQNSEKDKHRSQCKSCVREYRQANKQRIAKVNAEYRRVNRDKFIEYRKANKDKLAKYNEIRKDKLAKIKGVNRDELAKVKAERRKTKKDRKAKYNAEYQKTNKDRLVIAKAKYRQANKEAGYIYYRKRRARKKGAAGTFTLSEFNCLVEAYNNKCYYCLKTHIQKPHADHFIPLSKGGSNFISNIVPACPKCNLSKQAKMPEKFKQGELFAPKSPEVWLRENNL